VPGERGLGVGGSHGRVPVPSRGVRRRRLELVDDFVLGRVRFVLLHLGQELQGLLLFLGGVVTQQVGGGGEDGGSPGAGHQVEADSEGDVDLGTVVFFVLLLLGEDQLRGPVAEPDDGGTLQD